MPASVSRPLRAAWALIAAALLVGAAASCGDETSTAACPASATYDNRTLDLDDAGVIRLVQDDGDGGINLVEAPAIQRQIAENADAGCLTYPELPDLD